MSKQKRSMDDFAEEIQSHIELEADELKREGLSEEAARQKAKREFGSVSVARERFNLRGRAVWFENLMRDSRFALRQLLKNPGFTVVSILVMALGIGASVAIFAFVDAALIKPLPYENPTRLVNLFESNLTGPRFHLSYLDYLDWKRMNSVFSSLSVYVQDDFMLSTPQGTRQVDGVRVSDGFLRTLGVRPFLGRDFHDGEDLTSASSTVLLAYAEWQNRYGARPDIVGQSIVLNGTTATIIGVLPRDFHFAPAAPGEFWLTIAPGDQCAKQRGCHNFLGVGRLKDGVTVAAADAEMKAVAERLEMQYPDTNRNRGANVISLTDMIVGDIRPILLVLLSGAGLLLLIASVNVASLLLVRTENRKREVALRGALGATPARLMRQFVTEGLVLAATGSMLGIGGAYAAMQALPGLLPADRMATMPYLQGLGLNVRVLGFELAVSAVAGVLFSLTPLLRISFTNLRQGLTEGGRNAAGTMWRRFGTNLVVIELATAMVLLVGAGLLGKSFYRLMHVDMGLQPQNLAMMKISGSTTRYATDVAKVNFEHQVLQELEALPGVTSVALSSDLPVGFGDGLKTIAFAEKPSLGDHNEVNDREVSTGYFGTLQAQMLRGRSFTESDGPAQPPVTIINQTLAKRYFPNENPLGQHIGSDISKSPRAIIGVVDDIKEGPLETATLPAMYIPFNQEPDNSFYVIVRTSQAPGSFLPLMDGSIHQVDPGIATYNAMTMDDHIHDSQSAYLHRSSAWLVGSFAVMALLLGVVGLYGVIAYSVSQRTREIGVRMALGAHRDSIHRMVLREAGLLAIAGIAIGLVFSLFAGSLMSGLLFGVRSWDASVLCAVVSVLAAAALLASYLPARRAAAVNPMEALRAE
jgi:macrolide transport system ATP-binding/permease protein